MAKILTIILCSVLALQVAAQNPTRQLDLYYEKNFEGLMWQAFVPRGCVTLPMSLVGRTISLVTSVCITVFTDSSCQSDQDHLSISLAPGAYPDLSIIGHPDYNFEHKIFSYQECTDQPEGRNFRATLYSAVGYDDIPYAEYNNIRGCINLPTYLVRLLSAVDNHGTCITLYTGVDCTGNATTLLGGVSKEALNLNVAGIAGAVQSINLCSII